MQQDIRMTPLTEAMAREAAGWKYDGEYAIYNYPDWETMVEEDWAITNTGRRGERFFGFLDNSDCLVATTQFSKTDIGIMIGIGANPALLSKGYGARAIAMTVDILLERYPDSPIYLDVRTWNARAVRSYEKAGFEIAETIIQTTHVGEGEFYRMFYKEDDNR